MWCVRRRALLLHLTDAGARRFANIHELPTAAQAGLTDAKAARGKLLAKKRRGITRYQVTESIYAVEAPREKLPPGLKWIPFDELESISLSGPHRRWITALMREVEN